MDKEILQKKIKLFLQKKGSEYLKYTDTIFIKLEKNNINYPSDSEISIILEEILINQKS